MTDKPWKDMTREERKERKEQQIAAARATLAARRESQAQEPATLDEGMMASDEPPIEEAEGGVIAPVSEPEPAPARNSLLAGLDPELAAELSDDELQQIMAEAMVAARAEMKAEKKRRAKEAALKIARARVGLTPGRQIAAEKEDARLNEIIMHRIDIPEAGAVSPTGQPEGIRIDQKLYRLGVTYPMTRAVFETIRDIENKAWMSEALFEGKRRNHYNRARGRYEQAIGGGSPMGTRAWHAEGQA